MRHSLCRLCLKLVQESILMWSSFKVDADVGMFYDVGHRDFLVRSQAKIPEDAKSFAIKSTRQGSNDGELLT